MKRIITLLIAAGAFITVQAQTSREEARKVILGGGNGSGNGGSKGGRDVILGGGNGESNPSYPGSYPSSGDRQAQIDQVNREYDNKIQSIRNNTYLSYEEKQRAIRQLEKDRQARIRQINSSYEKNRRYEDDDDRYEDRKDNGKHKGWEKGKGNPHKSGGKNWKKGKKD